MTRRCSDSLTQQLVVSYSQAFLGWTDAYMFGRSIRFLLGSIQLTQASYCDSTQPTHACAHMISNTLKVGD
jgi:hypothetical protein